MRDVVESPSADVPADRGAGLLALGTGTGSPAGARHRPAGWTESA
ncbi:hypothetical protein [Actinosynnema sp. NPDC023587]